MTAYRDSFEKCPRCGVELNDARSARGCPACGGLWLDEGVLHEMVLEMLPPGAFGRLALAVLSTGEPPLACPTCGEIMAQTAVQQVPIERCAKQHGVWFDRDELARVLYAVGQAPGLLGEGVAQPSSPARRSPATSSSPAASAATEDPPSGPPLRFTITDRAGAVSTVEVTRSIIKLGRLQSAHVRIDDPDVARMHAVIEVTDDGPSIIDLGSKPGTLVNGERITKRMLQPGDQIQLGATVVTVTFAG